MPALSEEADRIRSVDIEIDQTISTLAREFGHGHLSAHQWIVLERELAALIDRVAWILDRRVVW